MKKLDKLSNLTLRVGSESLYFDVDEFLNQIKVEKPFVVSATTEENSNNINLPRFEFFKLMLDTVCGIVEDVDDKLGMVSLNKLSVPYKLSLNTLIVPFNKCAESVLFCKGLPIVIVPLPLMFPNVLAVMLPPTVISPPIDKVEVALPLMFPLAVMCPS